MGLLQVAKAIAEGKVTPSVSDLDRLIRLEEFLREVRGAGEQTRFIFEWRDAIKPSEGQDSEPEVRTLRTAEPKVGSP
jgi:hypothetical protein